VLLLIVGNSGQEVSEQTSTAITYNLARTVHAIAGAAIFDNIAGELDFREITPHKWSDFEIGSPLEWQN
jgi:hypothetical protein